MVLTKTYFFREISLFSNFREGDCNCQKFRGRFFEIIPKNKKQNRFSMIILFSENSGYNFISSWRMASENSGYRFTSSWRMGTVQTTFWSGHWLVCISRTLMELYKTFLPLSLPRHLSSYNIYQPSPRLLGGGLSQNPLCFQAWILVGERSKGFSAFPKLT